MLSNNEKEKVIGIINEVENEYEGDLEGIWDSLGYRFEVGIMNWLDDNNVNDEVVNMKVNECYEISKNILEGKGYVIGELVSWDDM